MGRRQRHDLEHEPQLLQRMAQRHAQVGSGPAQAAVGLWASRHESVLW